MRLKERELVLIEIAPRVCVRGALGGVTEGFGEKTSVRGSVLPEDKPFSIGKAGLKGGEAIRIIVPVDTPVSAGDGVFTGGEVYVVSSVRHWRAHIEMECVKMQ